MIFHTSAHTQLHWHIHIYTGDQFLVDFRKNKEKRLKKFSYFNTPAVTYTLVRGICSLFSIISFCSKAILFSLLGATFKI
jgi:hypothetical protein